MNNDIFYIKTVYDTSKDYFPIGYAVFKNNDLLKIFLKRSEAQDYINNYKTGGEL